MSIINAIKKRYARITPKQFVLTGVFMLALAGAIGGGLASKQTSMAAGGRDCSVNSIDKKKLNGGCGAMSAKELCEDIADNQPTDLKRIYAHFGLSESECDRFEKTVCYGTAYTNGKVTCGGETVITNAWSIGRSNFSYSNKYAINGKTYYKSMHTKVLKQNLPVMMMFDKNGTVEFAAIKACGNPLNGHKIKSGATCKALHMTPVDGKKNTYTFSTSVSKFGLAKIDKVQYYYNDGDGDKLFATKDSPSTKVTRTFSKSATVFVKVTIKLPGKQTKVITSKLCEKKVGVVKEEFLYTCDALVATVRDSQNRKFRFTVFTKQSNNVEVDSADFTLDDDVTTSGVTTKDNDGNIYKEYTFSDSDTHEVSVVVNFTADGKHVTSKEGDCVARVTPKEEPKECKPGVPVGHPDCEEKEEECVPGGEKGEECEELPSTGPAGVAGLFTGVSLAGAAAHRLYMNRKNRG